MRLDGHRRIAWEWRASIDLAGSHTDPWVVNGSELQTTIFAECYSLGLPSAKSRALGKPILFFFLFQTLNHCACVGPG